MPKILMIVSSGAVWRLPDGSPYEVGYFGEEALKPYDRFVVRGASVAIATPDGQVPHLDPYGLEPYFYVPDEDEDFLASITRTFMRDAHDLRVTLPQLTQLDLMVARRVHRALAAAGVGEFESRRLLSRTARIAWSEMRNFVALLAADPEVVAHVPAERLAELRDELDAESQREVDRTCERLGGLDGFTNPLSLPHMSTEQLMAFDALFIPGGHGAMELAHSADVARAVRAFQLAGRPIGCLCHGPAALLGAGDGPDGKWLFDGYRMTSFTDEEEDQTRLAEQGGIPWYLETALKNAGAVFDDAALAWTSHVVVDRNLITSQNPMSSDAAAEALLAALPAAEQAA